jgi:uncharacterized membrane protein
MNDWYSGIYKALLLASIISFIIYNFSSGETSLGALLSGLVALTLTLFMILYIILYNTIDLIKDGSVFQNIFTILNVSGPFFMMLGVIGLILYLIITNKNRIIEGHVSSSYYTFSNITILILLLQMYFLYKSIISSKFESTKKISKLTSIILYLFNVITAICSISLFAILQYYKADG